MDIAPCIKKRIKRKSKVKKEEGGDERKVSEREREKRGVEREKLLSKIYGNRTLGFC